MSAREVWQRSSTDRLLVPELWQTGLLKSRSMPQVFLGVIGIITATKRLLTASRTTALAFAALFQISFASGNQ